MLKKLTWLFVVPCFSCLAADEAQLTNEDSAFEQKVFEQETVEQEVLELNGLIEEQTLEKPLLDEPILIEPQAPESITNRANKANGLIEQRVDIEKASVLSPFVITPHKPNYFLPIKFQDDTDTSDASAFSGELDDLEFKFQLSVKFPLAYRLFGTNASLWGAYTQQALWQAYNTSISSPFRETNYEPEAFVLFDVEQQITSKVKAKYITLGFNHQSNGRTEPLSRSWNRIYAEFFFESDNAVLSLKPWYRLPESSEEDDNPNIEKYLGYGELNAVYVIDDYSIDLMLRNNFRSDNKGAVQLGFTFPMWGKTRGYIQYFDGYGQSLAEYDDHVRSLGIGVMLTNWL